MIDPKDEKVAVESHEKTTGESGDSHKPSPGRPPEEEVSPIDPDYGTE